MKELLIVAKSLGGGGSDVAFNSPFAKSLVSMYAFPAKVLKKLSVNYFISYYDFIANCVTN